MGQEYFINSQELESKVRDLLPSQGGSGAGFDLSASTQIIPIVDLTESAQGSNLRQDLQRSWTYQTTIQGGQGSSGTVVNTTGYWKVNALAILNIAGTDTVSLYTYDGTTANYLWSPEGLGVGGTQYSYCDWNGDVFLSAGKSLLWSASNNSRIKISARQIASIDGTLNNPIQ